MPNRAISLEKKTMFKPFYISSIENTILLMILATGQISDFHSIGPKRVTENADKLSNNLNI